MTNQLTALRELAERVDGGYANFIHFKIAFGYEDGGTAEGAFLGSLDAAHLLHKAVGGNMSQFSIVTDPTCLKVTVCYWPNGLSETPECYGEGWHEVNPARAWLLAIIKAKITELEA